MSEPNIPNYQTPDQLLEQHEQAARVLPVEEAPPAAPRTVTETIRQRALIEPSIRHWWLLCIAVLLVFLIFSISRIWEWHQQTKLITSGTAVSAKVLGNSDRFTPGQAINVGDPLRVQFDLNGNTDSENGTCHIQTRVGAVIPIRVDVGDHSVWTDETTQPSLIAALVVGLVFLPLAALLLVIAMVKRQAIVKLWQGGESAQAVVIDRKQAAIAPMSYAVRCNFADGRDRRIITVFVPRRAGLFEKGSLIYLINSGKTKTTVAACWFY